MLVALEIRPEKVAKFAAVRPRPKKLVEKIAPY